VFRAVCSSELQQQVLLLLLLLTGASSSLTGVVAPVHDATA
jgi:hypothetical protein